MQGASSAGELEHQWTLQALQRCTPFTSGMLALLCRPLIRPSLLLRCLLAQRAQRLQPRLEAYTSATGSAQGSAPPTAAAATADAGAGGPTTAAGMVQTRAATAAQVAEQCRLERVISNLQASCSQEPTAPPVRPGFWVISLMQLLRRLELSAAACWCGVAAAGLLTCCAALSICIRFQQVSGKFAAVLVPLFEDPATGEVHVVLNQRSSKLKTHSGERLAMHACGQLAGGTKAVACSAAKWAARWGCQPACCFV